MVLLISLAPFAHTNKSSGFSCIYIDLLFMKSIKEVYEWNTCSYVDPKWEYINYKGTLVLYV